MGAPAVRQEVLFDHEGTQGGISKGGNKAGKVYPAVPSSPKTDSPGRLRMAALAAGFSSFKTKIVSQCYGALHSVPPPPPPPDFNTAGSRLEGGVAPGVIFPSRELADPPASQRCLTASLGPTARPLSGIAAGCSLSDTSQVAGPSGSTSHTAMAVNGARAQMTPLLLPSRALL